MDLEHDVHTWQPLTLRPQHLSILRLCDCDREVLPAQESKAFLERFRAIFSSDGLVTAGGGDEVEEESDGPEGIVPDSGLATSPLVSSAGRLGRAYACRHRAGPPRDLRLP
eukprot:760747-Hanusia_phi.AAC.6